MARFLISSDATIKAVKPGDSRKRLTDGDGLYLLLFVKEGAHGWRFDFTHDGRRKTLSLGTYPDTGLALARRKADDFRKLLSEGINPSDVRKSVRAQRIARHDEERREASGLPPAGSFEDVARELHRTKASGWSASYAEAWIGRMEKDLFPFIGRAQLGTITAPMLLATLRRIEARGAHEAAHTLRQTAGQVFKFGIATGRCERNPAPDLHGALKPINVKHLAAVLEPAKAGVLMRAIAEYNGSPITRVGLLLSALLFQRPGNIRHMEWSEVDLKAAMWTIPAAKMKRTVHGKTNGRPHLVPLAPQAIAALAELQPLTGQGRYVFPSLLTDDRCMSENTINTALRRMGYTGEEMTAHGFRAMARTIIVEQTNVHPDVIEAQLAHGKSGPLGAAYDRAEFMQQRRTLMTTWATYLEDLRDRADALSLEPA